MMAVFEWLESLSYATWVRESASLLAFPSLLFIHTLGMSLVAGGSTIISLALLGFWPKAAIAPLERLYPVMWIGFWVNLFSGVSIFLKDASIYGRNPDLYLKLVFVAVGVALIGRTRKQIFGSASLDSGPVPSQAKMLAWASLICWFCAIVTGRLIAYVGPVPGL
jgi:hypothetical protein